MCLHISKILLSGLVSVASFFLAVFIEECFLSESDFFLYHAEAMFDFLSILRIFYVYKCSPCMYVCALCVCLVPAEVKRRS